MQKTFILTVAIVAVLGESYHAVQTQPQTRTGAAVAATAGTKGGQDMFGPYEVVKGWPKDIGTLPGNEKWTYGAGQGVFAESANRVFMLFRGELPRMAPPAATLLPQVGPSISFPVAGLWRDATTASLPGT